MIKFSQIQELMNGHVKASPLVSLYIGADGKNHSKRDYEVIVKDLIKGKEKELMALSSDKESKTSVESDFEKIREFIKYKFDLKGKKGLALFTSSRSNFWQVYPLPRPVKDMLVIDRTPYVRPLIALFDEHRRFCIALVDQSKARIFEVFMGEIEEHTEFVDSLPKKPKAGGWKGNEERRIERHFVEEVHRHFKRVADALEESFKTYHFDQLIVGGHRAEFSDFESMLPASLKERIVARLELDLHAPKELVLNQALTVEQQVAREQGEKVVKRLNELLGERMAVSGILGTLTAHRRGQVHSLVVNPEYQVPGFKCVPCGYLETEARVCPKCDGTLSPIPDLVDDLIESLVNQGCRVEYVSGAGQINQLGGIGAILRFKI